MSRKNKLKKFADLLALPNVFENIDYGDAQLLGEGGQVVDMKGRWHEAYFQNDRPITLELACGRGEYTIGLARRYPERNFIGVDIKGARLWKGAGEARAAGLSNAAFLRIRIEAIADFFAPGEVHEIWITFPDPFLRESKADRRLTSPPFLDRYRDIIGPEGLIHLKTDETNLYEFSLGVAQTYPHAALEYHNPDIYAGALPLAELELRTHYENLFLNEGKAIKYLRFVLKGKEGLAQAVD